MRIGGLASGIDTESIIRDMMNAKRIPLMKVTQKKQTLEWQLDSYRAVNRKLNDFSKNTFDKMILSDSFRAKKMSISAPDDVSITNKNSTDDFSGTIKIDKLAKNSTMQSDVITGALGKPSNTTLDTLGISGTEITISAVDENGQMKNTTVQVDPSTDTLSSLMSKITKETGVNAFYDAKTGQIAMSTKFAGTDGAQADIAVTSNGNIASGLGLTGRPVDSGQQAEFFVNGLKMTSSTNKVEVNGFEFELKAAKQTDINFSSKPDTEAVMENIVKFVDDYNKLMDELNGLVRERTNRDFKPLSAEEKSTMSDKEIELWEEKAKSGLLKNDPIVSGMVSKMRTALMGTVTGQGSLQDIGIGLTKGVNAWKDNGKLVIDEKKLKEAIEADPDKVYKLFSQTAAPAGAQVKPGEVTGETGFAQRLKEIADNTKAAIQKRAGDATSTNASFTLGRNLDAMNKQMDVFQARLKLVENRLWREFSAMENAIQRANAQSASLASALGGGA